MKKFVRKNIWVEKIAFRKGWHTSMLTNSVMAILFNMLLAIFYPSKAFLARQCCRFLPTEVNCKRFESQTFTWKDQIIDGSFSVAIRILLFFLSLFVYLQRVNLFFKWHFFALLSNSSRVSYSLRLLFMCCNLSLRSVWDVRSLSFGLEKQMRSRKKSCDAMRKSVNELKE